MYLDYDAFRIKGDKMEHWLGGEKESKPLWERDNVFMHASIAYFVSMVLFVCLRIASGLGWFGLLANEVGELATDVIATVLIQIVIFLLVPLIVFKFLTKQPMKRVLTGIGFNRPSRKVLGYSFLMGVLFYLLNIFVAMVFSIVLVLLGYRFPSGGGDSVFVGITGLLIGIIIVGVLPGVCEEVSNRGILMRGFMIKLGVWRAVLLSSLMFGLMHMNI